MIKHIITAFFSTSLLFWACNNSNKPTQTISTPEIEKVNLTPIPKNVEIKIGNQIWAASNLTVSNFRNGDSIPEAKSDEAWQNAGSSKNPVWCYYQNDTANGKKYGKLYNWYAVNDKRGLSPIGWHIPSDKEWSQLVIFLGGETVAGAKLKSKDGWKIHESGKGTNLSFFSARPGGYRFKNGIFNAIDYFGSWWSSTESYTYSAWFRSIRYDDAGVYKNNYGKEDGFSIRCIKD